MSSPHAGDRPVLLPSSFAWNTDARLVGEVLETVGSAASCTLDDTRYLQPALTWKIAAELVGDCATTDYHAEHVRALALPVYALNAVWACHAALVQATADGDDGGACLVSLLSDYPDPIHSIDLRSLIDALERVLAVLSLDLPAVRKLVIHLVLNAEVGPEARAACDDVLAAWRRAGVAC
ncbi:hypothetical protein [Streptomyces sp. SID3343]|uniref:hypothetical protein n=1 Tax=Streptomyces sp. SID3343 TaxID=2690260 RepID=UPI00136C537B|nr:hypothetical protein [Streptomyces sp. SID3343]MYW03348.1 hypothetical protein [Streptomyces sp. SID3343]MYW06246.1 hypothetical protein [Streptomyces sp. SID3343]